MVEPLNTKAWQAALDALGTVKANHLEPDLRIAVSAYISALPSLPVVDGGDLAERLAYRVGNPSAWPEGFDQKASDLFRSAASLISSQKQEIERLTKELDKAISRRDFTQQWYAERLRKIEDVAKRENVWDEVAAIIANASATRQLPDGSFVYDPPNYAQQLNSAKGRAAAAESRVLSLEEEVKVLREALKPFGEYLDEVKFDLDNQGRLLPDDTEPGWTYLTAGDFRRARNALKVNGNG